MEQPYAALQTFGHGSKISADIDIIRTVDAGDTLTHFSFEIKDYQGAVRRCHLVRTQDQALLRVRGVNPHGGVVSVSPDLLRGNDRLDVDYLRSRHCERERQTNEDHASQGNPNDGL
jgi:hypothetical protein